jgi:hypothetical protein
MLMLHHGTKRIPLSSSCHPEIRESSRDAALSLNCRVCIEVHLTEIATANDLVLVQLNALPA